MMSSALSPVPVKVPVFWMGRQVPSEMHWSVVVSEVGQEASAVFTALAHGPHAKSSAPNRLV